MKLCDLLIVIGTSLQVHPFASLVNYVRPDVPRLLINREAVGPFEPSSHSKSNQKGGGRDTFWEGDADEGVRRLVDQLGWSEELEVMIREGRGRLKKEWAVADGGDGVIAESTRRETERKTETAPVKDKEELEEGGVNELQEAVKRQLDLSVGDEEE